MKITKKEFIRVITENLSIFAGVTSRLYSEDEHGCALADFLNDASIICEKRSATARSRDLVFSGGSHLYFEGKCDFHKFSLSGSARTVDLYVCRHTDGDYCRCMHYIVEK